MKVSMAKYSFLIRTYVKEYHRYPFGLFLKLIYLPVQMFMYVFLWKNITKSNEIDMKYLITYFLLSNLLTCAYPFTHIAINIETDVMEGGIANSLIRPYNYIIPALSKYAAWISIYSFIFIPAILFVYFYRGLTFVQIGLFLLSACIGMGIEFLFWYNVGLISLYIEKIRGIMTTALAVRLFVSGSLIPLSFFTEPIRKMTYFFPFRFYVFVPVNLLLGKSDALQIMIDFFAGIIWLIVLMLSSKLLWIKGIEKINCNIS